MTTKPSLYKKIGGIFSYMTGEKKVWCASCASWQPEEDCAIIDNFIKCKTCIAKENPMGTRQQVEAKERTCEEEKV